MKYNPISEPLPGEWLSLPEAERLDSVVDYHKVHGGFGENLRMHAVIHVVVENQIAAGEPPVVAQTLRRLTREGLSRHDAVHAVGSVLAESIFPLLKGSQAEFDEAAYVSALSSLTAKGWRAGE